MLLVVLKHRSSCDWLVRMFCIYGPDLICLIQEFMEKDHNFCVDRFVTKYDAHFSMSELQEKERTIQKLSIIFRSC